VIRIELNFRNLLLLFGLIVVAWMTYLVRDTVVLLGLAFMLMATLHPLVVLAERRGLSHSWSVAVVMLGLVLVPVAILAALSPLIISEVQSFANSFPTLQHNLQELLRHWGLADRVNQTIDRINLQDRIASIAVVSAQQTISTGAKVFSVIVIAGYLLSDGRRLQLMLHEFVPRRSERHIEPLLEGMERVVGGYIRGQILTSLLFGVFATVLCFALRVPNPLLLGIVAAIGDVIPLFGVPLAMLITVVVAFTASVWQPIGVVAGYVIYGQLESHLLVPKIYARTVNMSPLLVIVATIFGGALDGFIGIFIAIPVVGALKVILDYIVAERRRGREAAAEAMRETPTDKLGEEETKEEHTVEPDGQVRRKDVPKPTYSPFESVPEEEDEEPATVSGARYVTLTRVKSRRFRSHDRIVTVRRGRMQAPHEPESPTEAVPRSVKRTSDGAA
jgi:predicted PurR-regulated permease PerM